MTPDRRALLAWLAVGALGFLVVPWYALQDSVLEIAWLRNWAGADNAPALLQALRHGRIWLLPLGLLLVAAGVLLVRGIDRRMRANGMIVVGASGFIYLLLQGFAIVPSGWNFEPLTAWFGPLTGKQFGMGLGACLVASTFAMIFALGIAGRGLFKGDAFVAGTVVAVGVLVAVFTFYPVLKILIQAVQNNDGAFSPPSFVARLFTEKIWGLSCIAGSTRCGVAWNTLLLATACAAGCTALGLAFALVVTRTGFRYKKFLRVLSVLPIITPPFVIGLGLILLFGRWAS